MKMHSLSIEWKNGHLIEGTSPYHLIEKLALDFAPLDLESSLLELAWCNMID